MALMEHLPRMESLGMMARQVSRVTTEHLGRLDSQERGEIRERMASLE